VGTTRLKRRLKARQRDLFDEQQFTHQVAGQGEEERDAEPPAPAQAEMGLQDEEDGEAAPIIEVGNVLGGFVGRRPGDGNRIDEFFTIKTYPSLHNTHHP
jgi:hypothetical protein